MKTYIIAAFLLFGLITSAESQHSEINHNPGVRLTKLCQDSRPWTRWWWFATMISKADINDPGSHKNVFTRGNLHHLFP